MQLNNDASTPMTRNAPLVSIIVPVYNVETYLRQCLDSLAGQTLADIEIICVDDASTDHSREILHDYAARDSRIRVFGLPVNSRQGAARNLGLENAHAPYIGFVDSDDFVAPEYFENLYRAIVRHDADIIVTSLQNVDEQGKPLARRLPRKRLLRARSPSTDTEHWNRKLGPGWEQNRDFSMPLQRMNCMQQFMIFNKLYRRELVESVKFPENIRFEDMPFVMEVFHQARRVFTTPEGGYFYRCHSTSTSYSLDFRKNVELFTVMRMLDGYVATRLSPEEQDFCRTMLKERRRYSLKIMARTLHGLSWGQWREVRPLLTPQQLVYFFYRLLRRQMAMIAGALLIVLLLFFAYYRVNQQ